MAGQGGFMWLVIDVVMVAALAAAMVYGVTMWRRRYRDSATREVRDEETERLYHERETP